MMQNEPKNTMDGGNLPRIYGPDRDAAGRFAPNHTASVQHGLFTERDLMNLRADIDAAMAVAIADDGGDDNVPVRRRMLIEKRMRLHRRFLQLDNALEVKGMFDGKGRLRLSWLQRLEGLAAAIKGIDSLLGLARKPKDITPDLDSYVREKYGRRDGGDATVQG